MNIAFNNLPLLKLNNINVFVSLDKPFSNVYSNTSKSIYHSLQHTEQFFLNECILKSRVYVYGLSDFNYINFI